MKEGPILEHHETGKKYVASSVAVVGLPGSFYQPDQKPENRVSVDHNRRAYEINHCACSIVHAPL